MDDIWDHVLKLLDKKYNFQVMGVCKKFYNTISNSDNNNDSKLIIILSYELEFFNYYCRIDDVGQFVEMVYTFIKSYNLKIFKKIIYFIKYRDDYYQIADLIRNVLYEFGNDEGLDSYCDNTYDNNFITLTKMIRYLR